MTGHAGGVPAGPRVVVLNGINVSPLDHFLPEASGTFGRVNPDMLVWKRLPNIGNHRSTMSLLPIHGTVDNHVVDFHPVLVYENFARASGHSTHIVPSVSIVGD